MANRHRSILDFRLPKRGRKGWQPETAMRVGCRGLPLLVVSGETLARAKMNHAERQPETVDGVFRLPMFARDG